MDNENKKVDTLFVAASDVFSDAFEKYIAFLDTFYYVLPAEVDEEGTTCA